MMRTLTLSLEEFAVPLFPNFHLDIEHESSCSITTGFSSQKNQDISDLRCVYRKGC